MVIRGYYIGCILRNTESMTRDYRCGSTEDLSPKLPINIQIVK